VPRASAPPREEARRRAPVERQGERVAERERSRRVCARLGRRGRGRASDGHRRGLVGRDPSPVAAVPGRCDVRGPAQPAETAPQIKVAAKRRQLLAPARDGSPMVDKRSSTPFAGATRARRAQRCEPADPRIEVVPSSRSLIACVESDQQRRIVPLEADRRTSGAEVAKAGDGGAFGEYATQVGRAAMACAGGDASRAFPGERSSHCAEAVSTSVHGPQHAAPEARPGAMAGAPLFPGTPSDAAQRPASAGSTATCPSSPKQIVSQSSGALARTKVRTARPMAQLPRPRPAARLTSRPHLSAPIGRACNTLENGRRLRASVNPGQAGASRAIAPPSHVACLRGSITSLMPRSNAASEAQAFPVRQSVGCQSFASPFVL
jgi:hypothetical protein